MLNRDEMIRQIDASPSGWDIVIIGGGATGMGIAVDAASRGYRTVLLEQVDFGKGTSSRSTKLAHGGVRYLQQGNISLVLEALRERGLMRQNAPHIVHDLAFVVPRYDWWEGGFYGFGLKVYDMMAGRAGFGRSRILTLEETQQRLPTVETKGLRGGVLYYDGQFDDTRLLVHMARTAAGQGAVLLNHMPVTGLLKTEGFVRGVTARDGETGKSHEIRGRIVINATGPFTDGVRKMEDPAAKPMIAPSQGVHLVLDRSFLPGDAAIMVPKTDDGRVLFAIPWGPRTLVGTTDTPIPAVSLEPRALPEEIAFLLEHASRYLTKDPTPADVRSVFVGIRPLVASSEIGNTAALSRDHTVHISHQGLITVAGGKWTTYRKIAEDAVDQASMLGELEPRKCVTEELRLHGCHWNAEQFGDLAVHGSHAPAVQALCRGQSGWGELLHPTLPYRVGEVVWAARHEMARTVEDVLSRRTRSLLFGARASIEVAPKVAEILARELKREPGWKEKQVSEFTELARGYCLD